MVVLCRLNIVLKGHIRLDTHYGLYALTLECGYLLRIFGLSFLGKLFDFLIQLLVPFVNSL